VRELFKWSAFSAAALALIYITAFVFVHKTTWYRRPAMNMAYFYYSDSPVAESLLFYGFLPLRRIGYHSAWFNGRHNAERESIELSPMGP